MRVVKTILSICFLFLAAAVFAGDKEVSNELPDEIKNLNENQILKCIKANYTSDPEKDSTIPPTMTSVVVKLKLKRNGSVDTAVVVYCEEPKIGFEKLALETVLETRFHPKLRRRKVDRSWFYTEVVFNRIGYYPPIDTVNSNSSVDSSKPDVSDFIPVEIIPEIIWKNVPDYPRLARQMMVTGRVVVRVLIGITGRPIDVVIQETTDPNGEYGFNEAAQESAMKCFFKPAFQEGKPVKVWVSFPYEFVLHGLR